MSTNQKKHIINFLYVFLAFAILQTLVTTGLFNRYYSTILILIVAMIIVAVSLNLTTGMLGQLVLGHAAFMALGAYGAALLAINLNTMGVPGLVNFIISAVFGGLIASIASLLVGFPALRLKGDYLGIMTLGFGEIVLVFITNFADLTGGAQGLKGIPRIVDFATAFWTMIIVVTTIVFILNSRHGRAIKSIRENEIAAEAVGISLTKYKLTTFAISAFFAGVGGAIYAFLQAFLAPNPISFGFIKSVEIFIIVVLGGMGSITGTIVATSILIFLPEALRDFSAYRMSVYSFLLVVMMLFRPQGLFGTSEIDVNKLFKKWFSFGVSRGGDK